jgi:hypothetical protein
MASRGVLCLVLLALAVCQEGVTGARPLVADDPTPVERIQKAFEEVTTMSDNLRKVVLDITIFNAPVKAPLIAQGFGAIVEKITEINARFDSLAAAKKLSPLSDDDAKLVVESLTTFVKVHQALLSTVIGKQGLLAQFPFFLEPIRVVLVALEGVVDTFAFNLIGIIPTQAPAANAQFSSLSVTLSQAIGSYSLNSAIIANL